MREERPPHTQYRNLPSLPGKFRLLAPGERQQHEQTVFNFSVCGAKRARTRLNTTHEKTEVHDLAG